MHGRCKHIDVRFHFLRDLTKDGTVELVHCRSEDQLADLLTKPLKLESFCKLREGLGICDVSLLMSVRAARPWACQPGLESVLLGLQAIVSLPI
ncbi:hypothetical protein L195_g012900 [Trifolium pratense]|uniref:Copia protein n=1 Tax=Trifolium pratense TaxID=57577 RepID=A0A2K3PLL8_TRIPR|nr:hypothetical protein L195_g012900 [Trifolium pratense]